MTTARGRAAAPLAAPGHRHQALAARRVPGPAAARPGRRARPPPGLPRRRAGGGLLGQLIDLADASSSCRTRCAGCSWAASGWRSSPSARSGDPRAPGPVPQRRRGPAARRAHLPEAVPGARPAHRRDRRRHRPVDAAARPQGAHQQHHRGRHGRRRRRLVGQAARGARHPAGGRHPQLHRGARRRRAAHERPAPVPLPGHRGRRPGRPGRRPVGAGRPRLRQPADRGDDGDRGRRLRGGRAPGQPGPRRARPGRARVAARRSRSTPSSATASSLDGQSRIMRTRGIRGSGSRPPTSDPSEDALAAIAEADLIVLGPGSLYTSLLPEPARAGHPRRAAREPRGLRVFVCNVATQPGETEGYDLAGARRGAGRPHGAGHRRRRPRQQPLRGQGPGGSGTRSPSGCAGRPP